jgi:two-component system NarL family sensor kinase
MDAPFAVIEPAREPAGAQPEARVPAVNAPRRDAGAREESDLRRLADGLLNLLESERISVAGIAGEEVSVITMARYLIEEAGRRLARGELEGTPELLQNAGAWIRDAANQLLTLGSGLHPKVLDDLGLVPALSMHFREFNRENRAVFVSPRITVAEHNVPPPLKLAIFRIVQAALSNVARHSKASAVRVFLSFCEDELCLTVEDNGVGFDVERWRHRRHGSGGVGLAMIQRWAEASGGRCAIESAARHGTRVRASWRTQTAAAPIAAHGTRADVASESETQTGPP